MKWTFYLTFALLAAVPAALPMWAQTPAEEAPPAVEEATPASAEEPAESLPPVPPELTGETRFEGTIINMSGTAFTAGFFSVVIEEWNTPEEAKELMTILANEGQQALLKKVWDAKRIGYLRAGSSMGKPLFFARAIPIPGGYVVHALTNVPIAHVGTASRDYPFGIIEMFVPSDGTKGHGTLIGMAQVGFDASGKVQVTGYGTLPVRLDEVVIKKKKKK